MSACGSRLDCCAASGSPARCRRETVVRTIGFAFAALLIALAATGLLVASTGCAGVTVTAHDQEVISASRANAQAVRALARGDDTVPAWLDEWLDLEVEQWRALEAWSRGQEYEGGEN